MKDIYFLQISWDDEEFNFIFKLFCKKWENNRNLYQCLARMIEINSNEFKRYWYKGASIDGVSEHFNGVEGNWTSIKKEYFNNIKVDISIFIFLNYSRTRN